jgi:hypothetical protein
MTQNSFLLFLTGAMASLIFEKPIRNVHTIISANSSFDKLRTNGIGVSSAKVILCTLLR